MLKIISLVMALYLLAVPQAAATDRSAFNALVKSALQDMVSDRNAVHDVLVESVIRTSIVERHERWLIMYSPVHVVILVLYVDPKGQKFGWGLGPLEAHGVFNVLYGRETFHSLRYDNMAGIFRNAVVRTKQDIDYPLRTVWPRMNQRREYEDNETFLVTPIANLINPLVRRCLDRLDRAALVQKINTSTRDPQFGGWFTNMFIANAIPDGTTGANILFVNERDGRMHMFVPSTMRNGICVPGEPVIKLVH